MTHFNKTNAKKAARIILVMAVVVFMLVKLFVTEVALPLWRLANDDDFKSDLRIIASCVPVIAKAYYQDLDESLQTSFDTNLENHLTPTEAWVNNQLRSARRTYKKAMVLSVRTQRTIQQQYEDTVAKCKGEPTQEELIRTELEQLL